MKTPSSTWFSNTGNCPAKTWKCSLRLKGWRRIHLTQPQPFCRRRRQPMFKGIYTPVITPHTPDGEIDKAAFAEVIESLIEGGVHGIMVAGSTGEYYAQTTQERVDLAAYAKDVIAGRLPLIIGTGATRTEESIEYARAARDIGADGILVTSPPYAMPTERENARHALA